MFVDFESPLARRVAQNIWAGFSRAALDRTRTGAPTGKASVSAAWESLRDTQEAGRGDVEVSVFVVGQDFPEAIDAVESLGHSSSRLYGLVLGVPEHPSPLAGSLLYQGVELLTAGGIKVGDIEPALLHAARAECESYARRLIERLART